MSISSTVAFLANLVADHVRTTAPDPDLLARLAQVAKMPEYVTQERLDLWESELLPARAEAERSAAHAAMVAILELGRINLYGEIDPELTAEYLATAIEAARATGATITDTEHHVTDW
jgi:hypothetical protein